MRKSSLGTQLWVSLALLAAPAIGSADIVFDWNAIMLTTVGSQNPFAQARFAAIAQLAVFEAVNATTGDYKPYLGTITAPAGASAEAAAVAAAHRVLSTYFPGNAASLDAARASSLAMIPDGPSKVNGVAVGEAAAAAMIALRANDGSGMTMPYTPSGGPGFWQPTPPAFAPAILLHWGRVTPFGILSGDQFRSKPPPALTSGAYTRDFNEVKEVGDVNSTSRPPDRADVARFYAAATPVQVWNQVAVQVSAAHGNSLSQNARTLALLNIAINDSSISVFETKYFYQFWRPVTAIRAADTDSNPRTEPDVAFTPFIATPAFPSYPSAHASGSGAARHVLKRIFGDRRRSIKLSNPALPEVTLHYTKFRQVTDDIDDARVYGGIHFRFEQEVGASLGRDVAAYIYKHHLRCASAGRCDEDDRDE
jgi:hypothetical protein